MMLDWWDHLEERQVGHDTRTGLNTCQFAGERHKVPESSLIFDFILGLVAQNYIRSGRKSLKLQGFFFGALLRTL